MKIGRLVVFGLIAIGIICLLTDHLVQYLSLLDMIWLIIALIMIIGSIIAIIILSIDKEKETENFSELRKQVERNQTILAIVIYVVIAFVGILMLIFFFQ